MKARIGRATTLLVSVLAATAGAAQSSRPPVLYRHAPSIEPKRLAIARSVAAKLLAPGSSRAQFEQPFNLNVLSLAHQLLLAPVTRLQHETGIEELREPRDEPPTRQLAVLAILDPAYEQRGKAERAALTQALSDKASQAEPALREGMATAYAEGMDEAQLRDLDLFLSTTSGAAFARTLTGLDNNLDMVSARAAFNKTLGEAIPAAVAEADAASRGLPKPKTAEDLTTDDRAKIAAILGVAAERLVPRRSMP